MNNVTQNRKKWIAALRSGKYHQAFRALETVNSDGKVIGNCCLGVACRELIENPVTERDDDKTIFIFEGLKMETRLSDALLNQLGMDRHLQSELIYSNDNLGLTFEQIANYLEEEWRKDVTAAD